MKKVILLTIISIGSILNIQAQWVPSNGPFGGAIYSIAFNKVDSTVYAGTWGGGVYFSTDHGSSWTYSGLTNSCISSVAVTPDGSSIFAGSPAHISGIFRSTDHGTSWENLYIGLTNTCISSLVISPDGSKIFAGTGFQGCGDGVFLSTNNGLSWAPKNNGLTNKQITSLAMSPDGTMLFAGTENGIYLSTDNGTSWTAKYNGISSTLINSIAISPLGSPMLAGTNIGIFRSTDYGTSWQLEDSLLHIQTNSFTFSTDGAKMFAGTWYSRGVFLSTDQGISWNPVNSGFTDVDSLPPGVLTLAASPDGKNIFIGSHVYGVYRSDPDTISWASSNTGLMNISMKSFAFSPSDANIFAGAGGIGIFRSTDNGINWTAINNGMTGGTVTSLAVNSNDSTIYAGTWRSGKGIYISTDNGASWTGYNPGLTVYGNVNCLALSSDGQKIFAGYDGQGIVLSTDKGLNWTVMNTGLTHDTIYSLAFSKDETELFAGTLGGGVFLSTDNGANWVASNTGLSDKHIYTLAVGPDSTEIFAGTSSGVYRSTNNGVSWVHSNNGISVYSYVMFLAISPDGTSMFAGTGWDGIYFSTDHGQNWTLISDGLPNLLLSAVAIDRSGTYLYVGSAGGSSSSKGKANENNFEKRTSDILNTDNSRSDTTKVYGVWHRRISEIISAGINDPGQAANGVVLEQNFPNPFSTSTTFNYYLPSSSFVVIKIYNVLGREVGALVNERSSAGKHSVKFDAGKLPGGIYFYKIEAGTYQDTKKFLLLK